MGEKGRVFTGARARLMINGRKVGYATNVSGSEELTLEGIDVLDNIQTEEFVPTGYAISFSCSTVRVIGETVKSLGIFPSIGKSPDEHLQNILTSGDLVVVIMDNKTKKAMMTVEQCKCSGQNFTVNARGVVGQDLSFVGIRMLDESEA